MAAGSSTVLPICRGQIVMEATADNQLPLPEIKLTRFGKELLKRSNEDQPGPSEHIDRLCKYIEARGLKVRKIE